MKTITVSEETFRKAFEATLSKLELVKLRDKDLRVSANTDWAIIEQLHRTFVYHVVGLQRELESA